MITAWSRNIHGRCLRLQLQRQLTEMNCLPKLGKYSAICGSGSGSGAPLARVRINCIGIIRERLWEGTVNSGVSRSSVILPYQRNIKTANR